MTTTIKRDTALLIDDDPNFREMIGIMAELYGVPFLGAADCAEGLRVLEREGARIRLILLDYLMPGMQPAECAASLIARAGPATPIVLVTAAAEPGLRAAELKLKRWLSKPFDLSALEALFREEGLSTEAA